MALTVTDQRSKVSGVSTVSSRISARREVQHCSGDTVAMQPKDTEYCTDGLPKVFLHSLRTLFDILDDGRKGFVHISEIESRWQGADTRDLPGGVLECLRRVTPPHGCLTFERFVAGLRYSMLNPDNRHVTAQAAVLPQQACAHPKQQPVPTHTAVQSACSGTIRTQHKVRPLGPSNGTNTQHRASSLQSRSRHEDGGTRYPTGGPTRYNNVGFERTGRSLERIPGVPDSGTYQKECVRVGKQAHAQCTVRSIESLALESPQLQKPCVAEAGLPRSQSESATGFTVSRRHGRSRDEQRRHTISNGVDYGLTISFHSLAPSKPVEAPASPSLPPSLPPPLPPSPWPPVLMVLSRVGPRGVGLEAGDSPGRPGPAWTAVWAAYTTVFVPLSSSLYSSKALQFFLWLKRMKEQEQEKDSLLAGLEVLEQARGWYQSQIHNLAERQRLLGQASCCTDLFTESNQSRMNVLIPKLQEVNRCLNDLISCSGMSFPSSSPQTSPLSSSVQPPAPAPPQAIQRLKDQNRLLTQEVTEKSERITQLEQEKSALIKQLFEARARSVHDSSTMDSTFI